MPREANKLRIRERERERVNSARPSLRGAVATKQSNFLKFAAILFCVGFLFFGFVNSASATTYYVSPSGSGTAPYDTRAKAATQVTTAITAASNGDTIIVGVGTYNPIVISKQLTIQTDTNAGYVGTVLFTNTTALHTVQVTSTGVTLTGTPQYPIEIQNAYTTVGKYGVYVNGNYNFTFNYVNASSLNDHAVYITGGGTNNQWNNFKITGSTNTNKVAVLESGSSTTFNHGIMRSGSTTVVYGSGASGTTTINDALILEGNLRAIYSDTAGHTINLNNCVISGEVSNSAYPVIQATAGAINLNNSLFFDRFDSPLLNGYSATKVSLTNSLENNYPYFTSYHRDGALDISLDDSDYASNAAAVKNVLDSYGVHFTWNINTLNMDSAKWDQVRAMVSAGDGIGDHQYSNTGLSYANALRFSQTGGSNCTVAFDGSTITLNCDGTSYDNTLDVTQTANDTLGEIITALNGVKGWMVANSSTGGQDPTKISASVKVTSMATITATATPMDILFNRSAYNVGMFKDEITDPKSEIESQIRTLGGAYSAWTCDTMAHAMSLYDAASKAAVRSAGLEFNRGNGSVNGSSWQLSDIDMFAATMVVSPGDLGLTTDQVRSAARNIAFQTKEFGFSYSLMLHNESGWAVAGDTSLLSAFVDELQKYGVRIYSDKEFVDWIHGGLWTDDGDGTWSRTFADGSNYRPLYNSPLIDAGTDVGLTSDYTGVNPIYGTPDIGAYEYQPPHDLTLATPDTIDVGAGARIYADGKFRDLATTTSVSAKLKIAPSGGSFAAYTGTTTRPSWLDVTAITSWTTSHKSWTESNAVAGLTNTVHTIGDLDANRYYTVKKDDVAGQNITGDSCTAGVCLSNSSGQITFTYGGTYSTHTFDMTELDSAKAITAFSFAGLTPVVTATINGTAIAATVPYETPVTNLVATFTTTGSSVAVGATTQTSGTTPNDFTSSVIYTVTAADSTTQNYTVTVTVTSPLTDATLSNLVISQGILSPIFSSGATLYSDSVANNVASVTVTPTKSQASATIKVNNVTVASGSASGAITLNVGSNTITAAVIAQDGTTTDTYTIIVTRAAAATASGGANLGLLYLNPQSFTQTQPAQNNMTAEQRSSLIAQIKQQLISLITQLIQLLTLQINQMTR